MADTPKPIYRTSVSRGRRAWRVAAATAAGAAVLASVLVLQRPFLFSGAYDGREPVRAYDAVIRRDRWGVPHIVGSTSADVAYGVGYAHSEDDFATLQKIYAAVRGRAGELTGAEGAKSDYVRALLGIDDLVAHRYERDVSSEAKLVGQAYADGLNRYAATHPQEVLAPGLFPLNGRDVVAAAALGGPFFFGMDNVLAALTEDRPLPREGGPLEERGSNGFAVSPRRSGDGSTMLLANSHVNLEGRGSWWEAHVTTRDGIDFSGAVAPGTPLPVAGHNQDIAFMSTNNRPDLIDVYKLELDASGERYRMDGAWLPLQRKRVWLHVRFGPFVLPVPKYVYRSIHGPVVINKSGAYAIRYAGMSDLRAGSQLIRMLRARDFASWQSAMSMAAIPCFNFLYADRNGNIGVFYNGAFPKRDARFNWRGILPGNTRAAIPTSTVTWSALPRTIDPRSGYVFSSNNAPWLASGPGDSAKRADFPAWLGAEDDLTNRALRASALLDASPRIDAARLWQVKMDKTVDRRSIIGQFLTATLALDLRGEPELARAQALLRLWDWNFDGNGPADGFAEEFLRPVSRNAYARLPLPTPKKALQDAVAYLTDHFGRIDVPLGRMMVLQRGETTYSAAGGPDVLRALVSYGEKGQQPKAVFGDSFIMLVRWDRGGNLHTGTIVPYGTSARIGAPHSADQAPLFAAERLKTAWYDAAELRGQLIRSYRPN